MTAEEWALRLLPLLLEEAQVAALSLPATAREIFPRFAESHPERLGLSPQDHQHHFWDSRMWPEVQPFTYARRLHNATAKWLQPDLTPGETWLPVRTVEWVRCYRR